MQVDNSDLLGLTSHPGSLNLFVHPVLPVGVELTFISEHNLGAMILSNEHFNSLLPELLLAISLHSASQVRRELNAMMDTCFREHIHLNLNFQTAAQIRKNLSPHMLLHNFRHHLELLLVAIGRITFLRRVCPSGRLTTLGLKFKVGKRLSHQYVSAIPFTRTMLVKIYLHGCRIKQFDSPFVGKLKL